MGNFSRDDTFDKQKHYVGVRLQQGVPLVDADWNESEDIRKNELQTFLKWFVGNGVPNGNDGFSILPVNLGADNDFMIKSGDGTPVGAGRCLVEGWEVIIESDLKYTDQPLFDNITLAAEWNVDLLARLSPPESGERSDVVYLDVWEREVDSDEDNNLVNPKIGIETCVRIKREWVVRVAEGETETPEPPQGHVYYPLANLKREGNKTLIEEKDITDLRQTELSLDKLKDTVAQFGYVVKDQDSFNRIFESAGEENNFRIKPEYKVIHFKQGTYSIPQTLSALDNGNDGLFVTTNQCSMIFCDPGTKWDYEDKEGGLQVDTKGCNVYYLEITGNGSKLTQHNYSSFLVDADHVTFVGCIARNRDCRGFNGIDNITSSFVRCIAQNQYSVDHGEYQDGFYRCYNLTECVAESNGQNAKHGGGFSNCKNMSSCAANKNGQYAQYGYGFYLCYRMSSCVGRENGEGKEDEKVTSSSNCFLECFFLSNCKADSNGKYAAYACGFANCKDISSCVALNNGEYSQSSYGFRDCCRLSSCEALDKGDGKHGHGYGFFNCISPSSCIANGNGRDGLAGYGFFKCINPSSCTAEQNGNNSDYGYGFYDCTNVSSSGAVSNGRATEKGGYGFYECKRVSSCYAKDNGLGSGDSAVGYGFFNCTLVSSSYSTENKTDNVWGGSYCQASCRFD